MTHDNKATHPVQQHSNVSHQSFSPLRADSRSNTTDKRQGVATDSTGSPKKNGCGAIRKKSLKNKKGLNCQQSSKGIKRQQPQILSFHYDTPVVETTLDFNNDAIDFHERITTDEELSLDFDENDLLMYSDSNAPLSAHGTYMHDVHYDMQQQQQHQQHGLEAKSLGREHTHTKRDLNNHKGLVEFDVEDDEDVMEEQNQQQQRECSSNLHVSQDKFGANQCSVPDRQNPSSVNANCEGKALEHDRNKKDVRAVNTGDDNAQVNRASSSNSESLVLTYSNGGEPTLNLNLGLDVSDGMNLPNSDDFVYDVGSLTGRDENSLFMDEPSISLEMSEQEGKEMAFCAGIENKTIDYDLIGMDEFHTARDKGDNGHESDDKEEDTPFHTPRHAEHTPGTNPSTISDDNHNSFLSPSLLEAFHCTRLSETGQELKPSSDSSSCIDIIASKSSMPMNNSLDAKDCKQLVVTPSSNIKPLSIGTKSSSLAVEPQAPNCHTLKGIGCQLANNGRGVRLSRSDDASNIENRIGAESGNVNDDSKADMEIHYSSSKENRLSHGTRSTISDVSELDSIFNAATPITPLSAGEDYLVPKSISNGNAPINMQPNNSNSYGTSVVNSSFQTPKGGEYSQHETPVAVTADQQLNDMVSNFSNNHQHQYNIQHFPQMELQMDTATRKRYQLAIKRQMKRAAKIAKRNKKLMLGNLASGNIQAGNLKSYLGSTPPNNVVLRNVSNCMPNDAEQGAKRDHVDSFFLDAGSDAHEDSVNENDQKYAAQTKHHWKRNLNGTNYNTSPSSASSGEREDKVDVLKGDPVHINLNDPGTSEHLQKLSDIRTVLTETKLALDNTGTSASQQPYRRPGIRNVS